MPQPDFSSAVPQFPLNSAGTFGQNAMLSYGRFFTGTGGLPAVGQIIGPTGVATGIKNAGPAGWPNIGATLVATGRYNIMHPPETVLSLDPKVAVPSGVQISANQVRGSYSGFAGDATLPGFPAATGITQIQVFHGVATGGNGALVNPPTGTRFDLWLLVAPNNTQGFTQF